MADLSTVDVIVLAGGLGTRLRSVAPGVPKTLLQVRGRPLLSYLLDQVRDHGARRVVLALGHLAGQIEAWLRGVEPGLEVVTSVEPRPLGTAGAIRAALPVVRSDRMLVMNGDSYTLVDLGDLHALHLASNAAISLVATSYVPQEQGGWDRFGVVEVDADGRVLGFREKRGPAVKVDGEEKTSACREYVNTGVYVVERDVVESADPGSPASMEREIFPRWIGERFRALVGDFPFIDVGVPEAYRTASAFFDEVVRDH